MKKKILKATCHMLKTPIKQCIPDPCPKPILKIYNMHFDLPSTSKLTTNPYQAHNPKIN